MLLYELRKNPEKNPKLTPLDELKAIAREHIQDINSIFVTFTKIDKLGSRPQSQWDTPLGICAYPIVYAIGRKMNVPYQADAPFIQVFKVKDMSTVWELSDQNGPLGFKQKILKLLDVKGDRSYEDDTSHLYDDITEVLKNQPARNRLGVRFREVLRKAGLTGIVDRGQGIIHPHEDTQGIFFDTHNLEHLTTVDNSAFYLRRNKSRVEVLQRSVDTIAPREAYQLAAYKKTRSPQLENIMALEPYYLVRYIVEKIKKRLYKWEPFILDTEDPQLLSKYASALARPWREAEPIIAQNPLASLEYAEKALQKNRFPAGEPAIIQAADGITILYVKHIIKGRWPIAESGLKLSKRTWDSYIKTLSDLGIRI
jgi:hypothetical protein